MDNSLNDMQLNGVLLNDLYRNALYQIGEHPQQPAAPPPEVSFVKFLGGNASSVLILVHDQKNTFLGEEEMNLLIKMLDACKMTTGDVAIVNLANEPHTVDLVIDEMRPQKVIVFGAYDIIAQPLYAMGTFSGIPLLTANGLSEMLQKTEDARIAKQKLWTALKTMFGIN